MKSAAIVFTTHRPEMIPLAERVMKSHEAVFLEESPAPGFEEMLKGRLSIEDYLSPLDLEYPLYSRNMCMMLRRLYSSGIALLQVEPFLEELSAIHEFFAEGFSPADIKPDTLRSAVYQAEKNATAALISYYRTAVTGSFEEAVSAVKAFARRDAARFRLRDQLRAIAVSRRIRGLEKACIEAGFIHYGIYGMLKKWLGDRFSVKPVFAAKEAARQAGKKAHNYGPGDKLTLLYFFHPGAGPACERLDLLAARSLVHTKIIAKEEIEEDPETFPHLRNELDTIAMVNRLSFEDCRRLFRRIRRLGTSAAREAVSSFLDGKA